VNEVIRIVLAILLLDLGLIAYFMVVSALFPARVARAQALFERLPGRAFAIGLVNFLFFATAAFVLLSLANQAGGLLKVILTLPALAFLLLLLIMLSLGLTAMVNLLGGRLFPDQTPWRRALTGAFLLGVGSAVPVAGWFLLFPYVGLCGMGAFILTFFQKENPA
jgi:hypothetical protein